MCLKSKVIHGINKSATELEVLSLCFYWRFRSIKGAVHPNMNIQSPSAHLSLSEHSESSSSGTYFRQGVCSHFKFWSHGSQEVMFKMILANLIFTENEMRS